MKEVKLIERKPSERLIRLVDAIPELEINGHGFAESEIGTIYCSKTGGIHFGLNTISKNPLKNAYKLKECIDECVFYITEESFCNLLEEHLYLTAEEKMVELLPQIQEHFPEAVIKNAEENDAWYIWERPDQYSIIVAWNGHDYKYVNGAYERIWEDKENLIVAKPKPWWETQTYFYRIFIDNSIAPYEMGMIRCSMFAHSVNSVGKNAGVTTFKNKEEAQAMLDKLNAVLKGE